MAVLGGLDRALDKVEDFADSLAATQVHGRMLVDKALQLQADIGVLGRVLPEFEVLKQHGFPSGYIGAGLKLPIECFSGNNLFVTTSGIQYGRESYCDDITNSGFSIFEEHVSFDQALAWTQAGIDAPKVTSLVREAVQRFQRSKVA